MSITASANLVSLNISVWPASIKDKDVTAAVTTNANADANAGRFMKDLFAGTSLRKDIEKYAARCRVVHLRYTLPWADKGERLLPTELFLEYKQEITRMQGHFNILCDAFFQAYPQLLTAAPAHLGKLYKADDYPDLDAVKDKFGFRYAISPLPTSGDFRLDIPQADLDEVKAQYDKVFQQRLADAMREPWDRLHKMLTDMSDKLKDSGENRRFHDSFVTNPRDLCALLGKLNLTNDPKLEEARRSLDAALAGVDIEAVKDSSDLRATVKSKVDSILSKFDF